jgi:hypothetical protein
MKRIKLVFAGLASVLGILSAVAASHVTTYDYTLTTGGVNFELNANYNPSKCGGSSSTFCVYTSTHDITATPVTKHDLTSVGATGYNHGEAYSYTSSK